MRKIIVALKRKNVNNAGTKAKNDIEYFLAKDGFEKLDIDLNDIDCLDFVHSSLDNSESKMIVVQYGGVALPIIKKILRCIKKIPNSKVILILHDVESLRSFKSNKFSFLEKIKSKLEINIFNSVDILIVHNEVMKKKLLLIGVKSRMESIEIFDYFNSNIVLPRENVKNNKICFAGELSKSKFLLDFNTKKYELDLFGPNPAEKYGEGVSYLGEYKSSELPEHLNQSYGLVWDGTSLETCEGFVGKYLMYNNPHKTSLYLSCGLPVIIWDQAAIAKFVDKYNLGFTIGTLNNLDKFMSTITDDEYFKIKKNCMEMSYKIREGFFIRDAVVRSIKRLQ
ncbi:galactofuranosyltransferase [Liquorilactobacillus hordei]|uniref:Beta-1,6-galactofuranosyltransferase n=1 Tax=Liquorilactobacillus hordei TaxID=468911 RepID=A0A3S6QNG2_9LACO|nr:galactofuranosyltransferase [Liquorilactobacillus hordei]AUJ29493.1 hypothetical protein BSQ49_04365 [Liquorilactobacillus hordei]